MWRAQLLGAMYWSFTITGNAHEAGPGADLCTSASPSALPPRGQPSSTTAKPIGRVTAVRQVRVNSDTDNSHQICTPVIVDRAIVNPLNPRND